MNMNMNMDLNKGEQWCIESDQSAPNGSFALPRLYSRRCAPCGTQLELGSAHRYAHCSFNHPLLRPLLQRTVLLRKSLAGPLTAALTLRSGAGKSRPTCSYVCGRYTPAGVVYIAPRRTLPPPRGAEDLSMWGQRRWWVRRPLGHRGSRYLEWLPGRNPSPAVSALDGGWGTVRPVTQLLL